MTPNARPARRTRRRRLKLTLIRRARRYNRGVSVIPSAGALIATRDPAQAVSKRAPKKKKTYDSDEESEGYDDDSEDDWGTRRCRNHTFGT